MFIQCWNTYTLIYKQVFNIETKLKIQHLFNVERTNKIEIKTYFNVECNIFSTLDFKMMKQG